MRNDRCIEIMGFIIVLSMYAEVVEPGRHARLRGVWGNPCGFKSRLRHQFPWHKSYPQKYESVADFIRGPKGILSATKGRR